MRLFPATRWMMVARNVGAQREYSKSQQYCGVCVAAPEIPVVAFTHETVTPVSLADPVQLRNHPGLIKASPPKPTVGAAVELVGLAVLLVIVIQPAPTRLGALGGVDPPPSPLPHAASSSTRAITKTPAIPLAAMPVPPTTFLPIPASRHCAVGVPIIRVGRSHIPYALVTYSLDNCPRGGLRRTKMQRQNQTDSRPQWNSWFVLSMSASHLYRVEPNNASPKWVKVRKAPIFRREHGNRKPGFRRPSRPCRGDARRRARPQVLPGGRVPSCRAPP